MVKEVLTLAGFEEDITFKESRFIKPPRTTYAVYLDTFTRRGADGKNFIKDHNYTIELYSYQPDPAAEARLEAAFDTLGIEYEKESRYWIQQEQLFQTIYIFNHVEK